MTPERRAAILKRLEWRGKIRVLNGRVEIMEWRSISWERAAQLAGMCKTSKPPKVDPQKQRRAEYLEAVGRSAGEI